MSTATKRWSDPAMLLPTFRERVLALVSALEEAGHEPLVFETYRSRERAAMLSKKGTGIADSMHCYGCAADIICKRHKWDCRKQKCRFFDDLGRLAESLRLTWGGRFKTYDGPHVQGVPVARQGAIRAAKDNEARDAIVRASLGKP